MRRIQSCEEFGEGHAGKGNSIGSDQKQRRVWHWGESKGENSVPRAWRKEEEEMKEKEEVSDGTGPVDCRKKLGLHFKGTGESPVGFTQGRGIVGIRFFST